MARFSARFVRGAVQRLGTCHRQRSTPAVWLICYANRQRGSNPFWAVERKTHMSSRNIFLILMLNWWVDFVFYLEIMKFRSIEPNVTAISALFFLFRSLWIRSNKESCPGVFVSKHGWFSDCFVGGLKQWNLEVNCVRYQQRHSDRPDFGLIVYCMIVPTKF